MSWTKPSHCEVEAAAAVLGLARDVGVALPVLGDLDGARELRVRGVVHRAQQGPAGADAAVDVDGRVPAHAVAAILGEPHERVVEDERLHLGATEIGARPPVGVRELVRVEVDALLAEAVAVPAVQERGVVVVVHDVEDHADAARVRGVDERAEVVGRAVGALGGERAGGVVAPAARAGELGDRHHLDHVHAERDEGVEPVDRALVGAVRLAGAHVERAEVQLVDDLVVEVGRREGGALPGVGVGIDEHAVAVGVVEAARARIGARQRLAALRHEVAIALPGLGAVDVAAPDVAVSW